MTYKDKITFFYALEESLWDDKVEANHYFATLSILFVILAGSLNSIGGALQSMFDINVTPSLFATAAVCLYVWGLNVAESIVACTDGLTALWRSLLMLLVVALAYVGGVLLGGILVAIVCIILFVFACIVLFKMLLGTQSGSGNTRWKTEDGEEVHGEKLWGSDTVHGDDGKDYKIKDSWGM